MPAESPVLIEVALNGITRREDNPAAPNEPVDIAEDALRCLDAGAAIVHTHTDTPTAPPDEGAARYLEAYEPILKQRPDAILYPTMAVGDTLDERYGHHDRLAKAGAIRAGVVDTGSVNLGAIGTDGVPMPIDYVYANTASDIHHMMETCRGFGLGPSIAVFEPGFLRVVLAYERAGTLPPGTLVKFYFSEAGYFGGGEPMFSAPPIPEALEMYVAMMKGTDLPWAVAVLGGSLLDSPIAELTLERGGHLRVGLEDEPSAESNVALVSRAKQLIEASGRRVASCAEAAKILGLPKH